LIISPWGEILAEAGDEPCVIAAEIDPADVAAARQRIPALNHVRPFDVTLFEPRLAARPAEDGI
jgi:predicted amidohydrolase